MTKKKPPFPKISGLSEEDKATWQRFISEGSLTLPFKVSPVSKKPSRKAAVTRKAIQATLDLHGFTQERAYQKLCDFIPWAYQQSFQCVLIVTGKGSAKEGAWWEMQGVLKQEVPRWLSHPPCCDFVRNILPSQPHHGGAGALYVYLKKKH